MKKQMSFIDIVVVNPSMADRTEEQNFLKAVSQLENMSRIWGAGLL